MKKGQKMTIEQRQCLSKARMGIVFSAEHKANLSKTKSGENHPNYGKHLSEETKAKMRKPKSEEAKARIKANHARYWLGKTKPKQRVEITCLTCGNKKLVHPYMANSKYCKRECASKAAEAFNPKRDKAIRMLASKQKGEDHPQWKGGLPDCRDCGKKITQRHATGRCKPCHGLWLRKNMTTEHIRKILRRREMSSLEVRVQNVINKYNLPYKFVGNGAFFIERKNPDFININGKKIAVEAYVRKQKENVRGININEWMEERSRIFSKYGWEIIFIDGTRITDETIYDLLLGGGQH